MRTLTFVLITLLSFSLAFGQEKKGQTKTRQELLEEAKKASREWVEATKRLDALFPNEKPMAPLAAAEEARFIKNAEAMEKWVVESDERQAKSEKRIAEIKLTLDRLEEKDRANCAKMNADLVGGKIEPQIRDLWEKMVASCHQRFPSRPQGK